MNLDGILASDDQRRAIVDKLQRTSAQPAVIEAAIVWSKARAEFVRSTDDGTERAHSSKLESALWTAEDALVAAVDALALPR